MAGQDPLAASVSDTPTTQTHHTGHAASRFWPLALGSVGVVFGDIGTSPLYAFRDALAEAARDGLVRPEIMGVLSLALWALILVVTVKYVLFLMRASNKGEGGVLSLMALAQQGAAGRTGLIFALGAIGAALFYGDGVITPAVSVLSAVEGLKSVRGFEHWFGTQEVIVVSLVILTALFSFQAKGTAKVAGIFGPIMVCWFLCLGAMGVWHIKDDPSVLGAISPTYAVYFLTHHGLTGFLVMGAVFLTVTGAEALTADMGHFGRGPIQLSWFALALPMLALNYFGQAALASKALAVAEASGNALPNADWFFLMAPHQWRLGLVLFSAVATVIASQAVITGAFSLTQQAIQLGLLPRMDIKITSKTEAGQIYVAPINWLLFVGVVLVVLSFRSSSSLAHAYGISVTGTMVVTTLLAFIVVRHVWKWSLWAALALIVPLLLLDLTFFTANLLKVLTGGWAPLALGAGLCLLMSIFVTATERLRAKLSKDGLPFADFREMILRRSTASTPGTAVFLTSDPDTTPPALMHSLKHFKVLHERNVLLTIVNETRPYVPDDERIETRALDDRWWLISLRYGYMESPNIPQALAACRKQGLKFDIMSTSFFVSRRTIVPSTASDALPSWKRKLFTFLTRNAADPTTFFHLPPGRVVELGTQVSL
ncbi:potassium transporter Kup [Caulobacter segnis]|jgi:KUP system potassium uptake protein|uniref:potassium transporter Kup n=1 Tax=Caulobacter segnis TaxID=88688 RepID=UPI001CBD4FE5|nr:potassium transporter Kup [Caulobacter segnis]UAL12139.1 potassium transporter Kup [Caulobacter segnis]